LEEPTRLVNPMRFHSLHGSDSSHEMIKWGFSFTESIIFLFFN
jgi:hypothetical protein